ncbi:MAG: putative Transglutaminase-like superfamily protein [Promethearchaeota archaeon]|nr:MAG: putative Transglutaminase-like superfamily protein [Candidatus Lokiarchaeota archaeon]
MVELEEQLLSSGISKKKAVGVILIVGILISALLFSVTLINLFFDTQRLEPNENLIGAIPQDPILTTPPIPWDPSILADLIDPDDFADWLDDLDIDLTEEQLQDLLDDLLEQYSDMIDGNIDDLDLSLFAGLIGAFLLSDIEVFRVYDYDNIDSVSGRLWKYECFDQFTGTTWESTSPLSNFNFYPYSEYISKHSGQDNFTLNMPLSPDQTGFSSFVIPNLFPNPYIMENSVNMNVSGIIDPSETRLSKTEFNSTTLTLEFLSTGNFTMSYELFGLDLPTFTEINNSAVDEIYTPTTIRNRYIQLPPDISTYLSAHPNFESHYNTLDDIIQSSDNAAMVAYKIINYLESNFAFNPAAAFSNPAPSGTDIVEWFCQTQEGVWSDFVSAFCAFSRAFGVASRFVDGYNSRNLEEIFDPAEGKNALLIKQANIYNWAEVYVPTSTDGSGNWVQVDVCENLSPINATTNFNISVSTNFTEGYRNIGNVANISATLTSINQSVANRIITFRDESMGLIINTVSTDQNGNAWTTINLDSSQTIGLHTISASYSTAVNYTFYMINGTNTTIDLYLTSVSPSTVNLSQTPSVNIQGYLEDPVSGNRVTAAVISFLLFDKGSPAPIAGALTPPGGITDTNGQFDLALSIDTSLPSGEYEIRADFNGSWLSGPTYPFINDSSNRADINLTKEQTYSVWFYMNDIEANNYNSPIVLRSSSLELKALLLNESGGAVAGQNITFLDDSNVIIGQAQTNLSGYAIFNFNIDNTIPAGPNQLHARYGNTANSSYFILNAPINHTFITFPQPNSISKVPSDGMTFNISGFLYDNQSNPVKYGLSSLIMFDGGTDVSHFLTLESGSLYSDLNGYIYQEYSVSDSTPSKNYTLQLIFDGIFLYPDPFLFNFSGYSINFSSIRNGDYDLEVYDPNNITILFEVNGTPTRSYFDDSNPPRSYNKGDIIGFSVDIFNETGRVDFDTVELYDVDQGNQLIGSYTFDGSETPDGHYTFAIDTSETGWHAGLHQIRVTWGNMGVYNSTYVIIDEPASITIDQSSLTVQRGVDGFIISGNVYDPLSTYDLRGFEVGIYLFDSNNQDVSNQFNFNFGSSQNMIIDNNGDFSFSINSIDSDTLLQGEYSIRIDFNGTISAPGIDLTNGMVHFTSSPLSINLTAGTNIIQQDFYTLIYENQYPAYWVDTDTLIVVGNLTWDNSTGISGMYINVTIKDLNGNTIASNNSVQTDSFGGFNVSLYIDPAEPWPSLRSDSEIWVYFDPTYNNLDYIIASNEEFT